MDFRQGTVTTLHDLGLGAAATPTRDTAAIVPMMGGDVGRASAEGVLEAVAATDPTRVFVPARGEEADVTALADWVEAEHDRARVLWCNGPSMQTLLGRHDLAVEGKGGDVWLAMGPAMAAADAVCCFDADVRSASPRQVARLCGALETDLSFAKAYYTRIEEDRFFGRLCRLLYQPLMEAIAADHDHPLIDFLRAFRYPLAGEFAIEASVARDLSVPTGMGMEVGILGEVHRLAPEAVGQVDLGNHRHAHRPIEGEDGLAAIAPVVAGTVLDVLERQADVAPDLSTLPDAYRTRAHRLLEQYRRDARFNGLEYDADAEREQIEVYAEAIGRARPDPWVPAWADVPLEPADVLEASRCDLGTRARV